LIGDDLYAFIARRTLDTGSFYRIDRHDLHLQAAVPHEVIRQGGGQEHCIDHTASVMTMTTMGVGGLLIEDLGVPPDRWGSYNVTHWGHLRIRFSDDGSGQLPHKVETKNGGSRDYWNTATNAFARGDGRSPAFFFSVLNRCCAGVPVSPFPFDGRPGEMRELHSYADGDFMCVMLLL
jgi:hypothetical protein